MTDKEYLKLAINIAKESPEPVGCGVVIVHKGKSLPKHSIPRKQMKLQ